jgi:hypothetical protein
MKVVISSGHGLKIRGASDIIDEVDEARKVVPKIAEYLRSAGVEVTTFNDDVSTTQSENLDRIVDFHNAQGSHDLDVSVHFNCYEHTSKPMGVEVLYVTQDGLAGEVSEAMAEAGGFINRGPKYRGDLAFLNGTNEPAILLETCFVDSQADVDLYHENFDDICLAAASAIYGEPIENGGDRPKPPEPEPEPEPPRPPQPDERRTLSEGDQGDDVARVQRVLGLPADGDFGPMTENAVQAFQASCDLSADGVVGPNTYAALDELYAKLKRGTSGLSEADEAAIKALAAQSALMRYSWDDRGTAPPGYISGMALAYALAVLRYRDGESDAEEMAQADTGDEDHDALAWYREEFEDEGMSNQQTGVNTLRHLFVLMIGLGMRESSGRFCEGRDMSADNVEADTAEAGLFQTSWNIRSCSSAIPPLLDEYWDDPRGFNLTFRNGVSQKASDWDCYGKGDGAAYQWLAKYSPAFAVLVTGVGLRNLRQHWGPINRKEVEIIEEADELLRQVQSVVM